MKRIRSAGMEISDSEINGVLFCGIDQDAYAIQLDKWTSDESGTKYSPSDIATELILLERELDLRTTATVNGLRNATALLSSHGYSVNPGAQSEHPARSPTSTHSRSAPAPAPAPSPAPRPNPGAKSCDYCGRKKHTIAHCLNRRRDLQTQIDEIDAALPAHLKREPRSSRSQNDSSSAGTQKHTTLLAAGAPPVANRPPTPGPTRPAALPAPAPKECTDFFENNQVPRNKFFEFPYSSEDSS